LDFYLFAAYINPLFSIIDLNIQGRENSISLFGFLGMSFHHHMANDLKNLLLRVFHH